MYIKTALEGKLREMESELAKTVVPALTFPWLFT